MTPVVAGLRYDYKYILCFWLQLVFGACRLVNVAIEETRILVCGWNRRRLDNFLKLLDGLNH